MKPPRPPGNKPRLPPPLDARGRKNQRKKVQYVSGFLLKANDNEAFKWEQVNEEMLLRKVRVQRDPLHSHPPAIHCRIHRGSVPCQQPAHMTQKPLPTGFGSALEHHELSFSSNSGPACRVPGPGDSEGEGGPDQQGAGPGDDAALGHRRQGGRGGGMQEVLDPLGFGPIDLNKQCLGLNASGVAASGPVDEKTADRIVNFSPLFDP